MFSQSWCVLAITALCGALRRELLSFQSVKVIPWNRVLHIVIVARLLIEVPAVYDTDPQIFGKSSSYFQIVGPSRVKLGDFLTYYTPGVMLGTSHDAAPALTHIISKHISPQYIKFCFNIILPCVPR